MRLVITGGAGFIGSHLVDYYLARGDRVIVIDNLISGEKENIEHHLNNKNFTFIEDDVCDFNGIDDQIDLILHFACPASPFDYLRYSIETLRTMSIGTFNMLELAHAKKAKFLLASTSEVYGDPEEHPQSEEYNGNVNLQSTRAVYDEGKRFAETLTMTFLRKYGLRTGIVRIFNTYGERMRTSDGRVIPALICAALKNQVLPIFGDGTQTRSFCYISDMVKAITKAAEKDYPMPLNIGNPKEYTILELASLIKKICNSESQLKFLPLPESDPRRRKPDISKAEKILSWRPEVNLEEGLNKVIDWFRRFNE